MSARPSTRRILLQLLLVVLALGFFHLLSVAVMERFPIGFLMSPSVAPLFGMPDRDLNRWLVLPVLAFALYLLLVRWLLGSGSALPTPVVLALAMAMKVAIDVSVTMINGQLLPPVTDHAVAQYLADVPRFESVADILRSYAARAGELTTHAGTHPPGPVLSLWLATRAFGYDRLTKAFLIVFAAPISLAPLYLLARQLFDRRVALYSVALYLVTPSLVLLTATCMDALFAVFLISSIQLYFLSLKRRSVPLAVVTGISLSLSMFMTFATTFLGVYFAALAGFTYWSDRSAFRDHLTCLLVSGATFVLVHLLAYWTTGYDLLACLRGAVHIDEHGSLQHSGLGTGYESLPRYLFISATNLFGFFTGIGAMTLTLWIRELRESLGRPREAGFLLAYVAVLVPIAFSTLYTGETERVWMFMAPFVLIPAARQLGGLDDRRGDERLLYLTVTLLFAQTLLFEVFLETLW